MNNLEEFTERKKFRLRGAHLGEILGELFQMQEGESMDFQGRVLLVDRYNNEHNFGLDSSLMKLIKGITNEDYTNYRLVGINSGFSVPLLEVSVWAMIKDHPLPDKNKNGPFLFAELSRNRGYITIESPKNPFPEVTESDTITDGTIEIKKVYNPLESI